MIRLTQRRLLALAIATVVSASATACIFDSGGDYKGGGRIGDKGAPPPEDAGEETSTNDPFETTDSGTIDFDF
jgi:hypothetical protein